MKPELVMHLIGTAMEEGIELVGGIPPVDDVHAFYAWWIEERILFDHVATFWSHRDELNVLFVHYNDMLADLEGSMREVAAFLGIEIDDARWPALVEQCTFASMKAHSEDIGDFDAFTGGAETFLYKGTNDRWRGVLTDAELAEFERCCELLPAGAAQWLNHG
jgi:aryl sulfotransferase